MTEATEVTTLARATKAGVRHAPCRVVRPVEIDTKNVWIRAPLGGHWCAWFRLVAQAGHFVVGEMRVIPDEAGWAPAEWSGNFRGVRATVPDYGLTSTILKKIAIGTAITNVKAVIDDATMSETGSRRSAFLKDLRAWGITTPARRPFAAGPGAGRSARARQLREAVAQEYLELTAANHPRPVAEIKKRRNWTIGKARMIVYYARRDGLLPPTRQGAAKG